MDMLPNVLNIPWTGRPLCNEALTMMFNSNLSDVVHFS